MVSRLERNQSSLRAVLDEHRARAQAARELIESGEVKSEDEARAIGALDIWFEIKGERLNVEDM